MSKSLTLPKDILHIPYGREYPNSNEAQLAVEQFQEELDKLLDRFGVHSFIFNGSLLVKAPSAPIPTEQGELAGQIRTRAVCRADGCKACTMFAVAQGAIVNPEQNEILNAAYAMLEESIRQASVVDFANMEVKGPKQ